MRCIRARLVAMKAVVLHEVGPAENLITEAEWPRPSVQPGRVTVRVRAAGVCYRDVIDRLGGFPYMKRPIIPGHEIAGEVVEVGDGVEDFAVGDRVVNLHRGACGECEYCRAGHEPRCMRQPYAVGLTIDGGYAEYALLPASCLVALPARVPFEKAWFLACTAGVALRGLRGHARLDRGQTVLITGASGGVGLHAIQVARALGARVVAVTSSQAKVDSLRARGAEEVVVSTDLAFHKQVKQLTGGVDVAFDCVGEPTLNASVRSLKPMGRCVVAGNVTVSRFELNPGLMILNELSLSGTSACSRRDLEQVLDWVTEGAIEPVLDEVLDLDDAVKAHRRLESRGVTGRLVLKP